MKKVIISAIIAVIVLGIGVSALVMGLVPVNANDKIGVPDQVYIYCQQTNDKPNKRLEYRGRYENELEKIENIYNNFNNAFKQKALSALFNGELGERITAKYSILSDQIDKNYQSENVYTLVFYYKNDKTFKYNGEEVSYNYAFFQLTGEDKKSEVKIGLSQNISSDEDGMSVSSISYNYYFVGNANFKNLHTYVTSLINQ